MILKVASKFVLTSANLKEFRTNAGELSHLIIEKNKADLAIATETILDDSVSLN